MNGIIAWFAENKVAANVLMLIIIVGGASIISTIPKEMVPSFQVDTITISAPYPGASPKEVEQAVCQRIEKAVHGIDGVASTIVFARKDICYVNVSVLFGIDPRPVEEKVKSRVDSITGLPAQVSKIRVERSAIKNLVAKVVVYGHADETALVKLAEQVRNDLVDMDNITHVKLESVKPYEISIELSEALLQRYDLTFLEIVQAVKTSSLQASTGDVKTGKGKISVTVTGRATSADDYLDIVLRATPDGGRITLSDVATIHDGFAYGNQSMRFNGAPSALIDVFQVGQQDILDISDTLYKYVENPKTPIPSGIKLEVVQDLSSHFQSRIDLLVRNALSGLVLIFIGLMLFLRLRLSFWVCVGIPVAFLGAIMMLPFAGTSINMISTFAFLLVLGIVVDDAIIVGENIYSQGGVGGGTAAAIRGAQQVAKPVIFGVMTTILFFIPVLFLPGVEGQFLHDVPVVVIAVLIFSLVECLLILPAHLTKLHKGRKNDDTLEMRIQNRFDGWLENIVSRYYVPFLGKALARPHVTIIIFFGIFLLTISVLIGGWVKVKMMSEIEADVALVKLTYPEGTPIDVTREGALRIEQATIALRKEIEVETGVDQIKSVGINIGIGGDHKASVLLQLGSVETGREMSSYDISARLRKKVGPIPEAKDVTYRSSINPKRQDIDIMFSGRNNDDIIRVAHDFRDVLRRYPGVYQVMTSSHGGSKEVLLELKPAARDLGLTQKDLAAQVQQVFQGVHVQSLQRGQEEVKVYVRYPEMERNSLWHLENMNVRLLDGSAVLLQTVADVSYVNGPGQIRRINGKRVISVSSFIDNEISTTDVIMEDLKKTFLKDFSHKYPGIEWNITGAQKSESNMVSTLIRWYFMVILATLALMAILFRSYFQPLVVMSAIPFGLVGAVFGHWLMGMEFTLWSIIGMVAVSGVVVNDNLVLIDYINERRREGVAVIDAIKQAGVSRFRPIWLTTITTFIGLLPLMMESSVQAQFLIPMAVSLAYGELFATAISLIMVPVSYHVLDKLQNDASRIFKQWKNTRIITDENSLSLEDVYQQGYVAGLSGKNREKVPFTTDVLIASWEAGWDDASVT